MGKQRHFIFEMADQGDGEIVARLECQNIRSVGEEQPEHIMDALVDGIRFMLDELGIDTPPPEQSGTHIRQLKQ